MLPRARRGAEALEVVSAAHQSSWGEFSRAPLPGKEPEMFEVKKASLMPLSHLPSLPPPHTWIFIYLQVLPLAGRLVTLSPAISLLPKEPKPDLIHPKAKGPASRAVLFIAVASSHM